MIDVTTTFAVISWKKDPYKIIFIYKTGFKNEIGNAKERFGKKSKSVEKAKEMCSHIADEVKDVCSYVSDNTYREYRIATKGQYLKILEFKRFVKHFSFKKISESKSSDR